jgi:hypothetical protein
LDQLAIVTKLDAAHRQLTTAIRMYFDDDDLVSIHTLTCAAREIYEKHCAAHGVERMFEQIEAANPERTTKELWAILNGPRNFLKHPEVSMDLTAALELDDEMNAAMLWVACHDCAMLCKEEQPPEVQAYAIWFLATRFPRESPEDNPYAERADQILRGVDQAYPGLRRAPPDEQKRIGRTMVSAARDIVNSLSGE